MTLTNDDIIAIRNIMTEALVPVTLRLDRLETRFDRLETRFDGFETRLSSVEINLIRISMKLINGSNSRNDTLSIVPLQDGSHPTCDYPETICSLIVSGKEKLPGKDTVNNWNKTKSLNLIKQYIPDYTTDSDSDTEDSSRSRNRRLKVAKLIGITGTQLNFAQLSL